MSLRLRLAVWYGALFALILFFLLFLSYTLHLRGTYDDLDRMLLVSAGHAAAEARSGAGEPHLIQGRSGLELALRLFDTTGTLKEQTLGTEALPSVDPRVVLRAPSGSADDTLSWSLPSLLPSPALPDSGGAFGLVLTAGQRWRVYVVPLGRIGAPTGYLEALTPLGQVDGEMATLRVVLPLLGLSGLLCALLGGWAIAGRALRPVATMIGTAKRISLSRDLSRRVEEPVHRDELGRLATTLNEMLASLEAASQAQQRFVADASHELRAPLTAIQGNLDLLNRHRSMPEAQRQEALEEMTREADRLTRLVADPLALARADAGLPLTSRLLDLDTVVLDAFQVAHRLAHGQTLALDPFEPVQILGDEDRLKQVLLILLENALKYTPPDGHITLGLAHLDASVQITVQDTGRGIAPEDLPHVFERFYRADAGRSRDPGGTGLGLSIAHWITEQHGGTIRLVSQPGQGTQVVVCLPLVPSSCHATVSSPQPTLSLPSA